MSIDKTETPAQRVATEMAMNAEFERYLDEHPEELSLKYLVDHNLPVFVKNNTRVERGVILVEVIDASGRKSVLRVDNTNIPIELSARMDNASLGKSFHLRKLLDDKMLVLVLPSVAQQELKTPEAQRKLARLSVSRFSKDSDAKIAPSYTKAAVTVDNDRIVPGMQEQPSTPMKTSNSLKAIVIQYQAGTIDGERFIDDISDNARTYTQADWEFLRTSFPDNEDVQTICANELNASISK
jgi:hypothetical protein